MEIAQTVSKWRYMEGEGGGGVRPARNKMPGSRILQARTKQREKKRVGQVALLFFLFFCLHLSLVCVVRVRDNVKRRTNDMAALLLTCA